MAELFVDLEWWTCPGGFRLASRQSLNPGEPLDEVEVIVPNSRERLPYRPLKEYADLYNVFANIKSSAELLKFFDRFGALTTSSANWGDSVPSALQRAGFFRELLRYKQHGPRKLASFFKSWTRERAKASQDEAGIPWPGGFNAEWFERIPLVATVELVADSEKGVRLKIEANDLIGGLWWQLGQKLSGGSNFRECRQCRQWFEAGPGTGRRVDAEFCSDDHRIRFNSLKRTPTKGGG
jgi:hypothetical protein